MAAAKERLQTLRRAGAELTDEGAELLGRAREILGKVEDARAAFRRH